MSTAVKPATGAARTASTAGAAREEQRLAWMLVAPALGAVALVAIFPLAWTVWESLHQHDLRMPWLGRPFVGVRNYAAIAGDARFWSALAHTALFCAVTVTAELVLGLAVALVMHRAARGRGILRAALLVPWAIPTVVAGLLWRFMFDGRASIANALLVESGLARQPVTWLVHAATAWVPVMLADIWKTTPFVALLLLAGLQGIDPALYDAAAVDGAGWWRRLRLITIPLLRPAILVALIFRTLDAFRVFDLVYVLTGGGPGTSTEPVALYTFDTLLQNLEFGYGAALSVVVFAITFGLALLYMRALGERADGAGARGGARS
ncbi:MAG TPA: sugar ABC transporter permease [Gemmatimonadaceae bacterium]|nr:sugar ABC transporter permease [Gemmatimonadaceae bacterium]